MKRKYYLSILLSVVLLSGCVSLTEAFKTEKEMDAEGGIYSSTKSFVGGLNPMFQLALSLGTVGLVSAGVIKAKKGKKK